MNSNNSQYPLGDSHNQDSKEKRVFNAFAERPKTMRMVEVETGIRRDSFICRRIGEWLKEGRICKTHFGVCPISKYSKVGFYTTDKKQFPTSKPINK